LVDRATTPGVEGDPEVESDACVRLRRAVVILRFLVAEGIERRELDAPQPDRRSTGARRVAEVGAVTAACETAGGAEEDLLDRLLAVVFRDLGLRPQP